MEASTAVRPAGRFAREHKFARNQVEFSKMKAEAGLGAPADSTHPGMSCHHPGARVQLAMPTQATPRAQGSWGTSCEVLVLQRTMLT